LLILSVHSLRELTAPQEDALVIYLDFSRPCLKTDIKNLSSLLSALIEDQYLLSRTLVLEVLSEGQIRSRELAIQSLKELLKYSDDINYASYLTDGALSEPSEPNNDPSPYPVIDLDNRAGSTLDSPGANAKESHDLDTSYAYYLNLSSLINKEIDRFGEDYFHS
jgi:hypothetical protein